MDCKITKLLNLYKTSEYDFATATSIPYWHVSGVHFKYKGKDYFLYCASNDEGDYETRLYEGRCKCHLTMLKTTYGVPIDLIHFTKNTRCLKHIDTEHFIKTIESYLSYSFN